MSPVAADRASADSAPGGADELDDPELGEAELGEAPEPCEAEELEVGEAADWLDDDPQPAATSDKPATAAAHVF
jgi:hypothetical protein